MNFARRLFGFATDAPERAQSGSPAPGAAAPSIESLRAHLDARQWDTLVAVVGGTAPAAPENALHARALTLAACRRYREARDVYAQVVPASEDWQVLLDAGWCAHHLGYADEAIAHFRRGLALAPDQLDLQFALAIAKQAKGEAEDAKIGLARVLERSPAYPDAWLNVAVSERALGNAAAAEAALRNAVDQYPGDPHAWTLLGTVLKNQDRIDEALAAYARARDCEIATGEDAHAVALQAVTLSDNGRYEEAIALCERTLPEAPDPALNTAYAFALLSTGRLAEGFDQYEVRWFQDPLRATRGRFDRPMWSGQPLAGKTILLRAEQGIGDTVQFARYATPLKALGARVLLQVHRGMGTLATGFADADSTFEVLETPIRYDLYLSMMSLPRMLGTSVESIPAQVPYLQVLPSWKAKWADRLPRGRLRVGLAWAGNPTHMRDRFRSVPLGRLAPLWDISDVQYVGLQKDLRASDAEAMPPPSVMVNVAPELTDLSDAAAIIGELDLVVCVDTGLAHVAGALGKPVWMLLPEVADFRWLTGREDTPWYPTMRLFRQTGGGWDDVLARVARDLRALAAGDKSLLLPARLPAPPVARATAPADGVRVTRFRETRYGIMQYVGELDDEARSLERYGEYLPAQLQAVSQLVAIDAWIVEAGSGFGSHALWLAKVMAPEAHLLLYEARPAVARVLRQNLEANEVLHRVSLPRGTLAGPAPSRSVPGGPAPVHAIDELELPRLDLVKVGAGQDVQAIVQGAQATLWRCRPRLFLAAQAEAGIAAIAGAVRELGFRSWALRTPLFDPGNYNEATEDIFAGRQALAVICVPEEAELPPALTGLPEIQA